VFYIKNLLVKDAYLFFVILVFPFINELKLQSDRQLWFIGDETSNATMIFENQLSEPIPSNLKGLIDMSESSVIHANSSVVTFYSNGQIVLNEFSDPMPNGRVLKGDPKSMDGSALAENPSVCDQLYLFYTESNEKERPRKLYYSIIDKTIEVPTFLFTSHGDVIPTQRDIDITPLGVDIGESLFILEKRVYKEGSWLLASDRNARAVLIFNLDKNGINLFKTYDLQELVDNDNGKEITTIKFDSHRIDDSTSFITIAPSNENGILGHNIAKVRFDHEEDTIDLQSYQKIAENAPSTYGTAFSEDGTKFYYSDHINKTLHQFDFISEETTLIGTSNHNGKSGGLKRAINNKIYWANQFENEEERIGSLSVINEPNEFGSSSNFELNGYQINASSLPKRIGIFPRVSNDLLPPKLVVVDQPTCGASDGKLSVFLDPRLEPIDYIWNDDNKEKNNYDVGKGSFAVTMTSLDGCIFYDSIELSEIVDFTIEDVVFSTKDPTDCTLADGVITLSSNSFSENISFEIEFIDNNNEEYFFIIETGGEQIIEINGLEPGTYSNFLLRPEFSDCFVSIADRITLFAEIEPLDIGNDTLLCEGEAYLLETKTEYASYLWSDGTSGSSLSINKSGIYFLEVKTEGNCFSTDTIYVQFAEKPEVDLEKSIEINFGESTMINPDVLSSEQPSFLWSPPEGLSCIDCLSPIASPENDRRYTFEIFNESSCKDSASIFINVRKSAGLFLPNIFSPNGDEINDQFLFTVVSDEVQTILSFRIYNRWGVEVYSKTDISPLADKEGWDGHFNQNLAQPGVYVYVVQVLLTDETIVSKSGDVTLIN